MRVSILVGVPGSGKSTWVKRNKDANYSGVRAFSADNYFKTADGYNFDPKMLPKAHGYCLSSFAQTLAGFRPNLDWLIVDNTNLSLVEIAPYAALALAYEANLEFIFFPADESTWERNIHGVPKTQCDRMLSKFKELCSDEWPRHWPMWKMITSTT